MRCSSCSHEVKPIVAIDIDGTMGDYHGQLIMFAQDYFGVRLNPSVRVYNGLDSFRGWFSDSIGINTEEYRQMKLAYRQGGMKRTMPIFTCARALCWAVRDAGAELWITTTRPYLSLDSVIPDTVEWLRRSEIEYDYMLFDADKYQELARRVDPGRVVAVLDDLGEMYDAACKAVGSSAPILVRGFYNWGVQRPQSADLDACCDIVLGRIKIWKEEHGC